MRAIIILLICSLSFSSLLMAQTQEGDRRIEEEKRKSLQPSEVQIPGETVSGPKPLAPIDIIYFIELTPKRVTFRYDVCKALVVLMGVEDEYIDLDSQVTFLRENHLLPGRFKSEFDPMKPLRKGLTAYMFCKALDIKGGVSLRLFGMSERYAIQELAFKGIMSSGNVNDILSGDELISALTQAASYMAKKQRAKTAKSKD